ncbi:MAG: GIY-YIG nuclease family protein [Candidatus Niyogibacteria bacterium]|nr:MAG: GIY-YIG nuclease family protein [Candidatus Niyogibacteria bacterium]
MPSTITPIVFFYTYVLRSDKDGDNYIGYSHDLKKRSEEHKKGLVPATKHRRPLKLIYYEACLNKEDAQQRERYLKTTRGRRWFGMRLRNYKSV